MGNVILSHETEVERVALTIWRRERDEFSIGTRPREGYYWKVKREDLVGLYCDLY